MIIAVTYENGQVFQHFGHTQQFKIYDIQDSRVVSFKIVDTNGSGHGALATFLKDLGVEVLICGGIGGGAQNALKEVGIKWYGGVKGDCNSAVISFLVGKLEYNPDARCDHHDHGDGVHTCGEHSCK